MPTVGGCTNLPESESRFRRSASVAVPPPFTEVACYQLFTFAAGGEPSSPETSTISVGGAVLRLARGGNSVDEKSIILVLTSVIADAFPQKCRFA